MNERTPIYRPAMKDFHRDVFGARVREAILSETHVIVGDHTPEYSPGRFKPVSRQKLAPSAMPRWLRCPGGFHT
jgi:hypothetical protein